MAQNNELFEILDDIKWSKKGDLLDDEEGSHYAKFNSYMVLKFLSMNPNLCMIVNKLNTIQDNLSKKQLYKLLIQVIPKTKSYDPYINSSCIIDEDTKMVADHYSCSNKQAKEYIDIVGEKLITTVKATYGGKMKP